MQVQVRAQGQVRARAQGQAVRERGLQAQGQAPEKVRSRKRVWPEQPLEPRPVLLEA